MGDTWHDNTCHGDTWHDEGQVSWIEISMIRNMWVTHGMMRAMCQATKSDKCELGERIGGEKIEET